MSPMAAYEVAELGTSPPRKSTPKRATANVASPACLGALALPAAICGWPTPPCRRPTQRRLPAAASTGRQTAQRRKDRLDARGSSGTLKWVQLVGRLRVLAVYTRMTTTGSTNTNTIGPHTLGWTR